MRYVKISALCSFLCKPLPSSVDMLKSRQSGIGLDHAPHVLPGLGMFIKCFKKLSLAFSCQASTLTMPDKVHLRSLQHAWFGRFQLCMIFYDCAGLHFDADLNEDMSILRLAWNFLSCRSSISVPPNGFAALRHAGAWPRSSGTILASRLSAPAIFDVATWPLS
jgi:hypothetical protein